MQSQCTMIESLKNQQSKPEPKPYTKVNAYTLKPSFQQILTLILFIIHFAMHCIFLIRPILAINNPILYVMWGMYFLLLLCIAYDYCILTCGDPVDQLLPHPEQVDVFRIKAINYHIKYPKQNKNSENIQQKPRLKKKNPYKIRKCEICLRMVKWNSYHCWTCKRCVEDMDHHCKYLNSCIGGKNYFPFFRLLSIISIYFILSIGIAIWILVKGFQEQRIRKLSFTVVPVIIFIVYTSLVLAVVQILLWFHCYISCYRGMTTIQYLVRKTGSNGANSNQKISSQSGQTLVNLTV